MFNTQPEYQLNELATLYPEMTDEEFEFFCEDIKNNGLNNPITLHNGQIIDGRHRYLACKKLGIEPIFTEYKGDNPFNYVVSQNSTRRNLNKIQFALTLLDKPRLKHGSNKYTANTDQYYTTTELSKLTGLSVMSLNQLNNIKVNAIDDLKQLVINKKISIEKASDLIKDPTIDQKEVVNIISVDDKASLNKVHTQAKINKRENDLKIKAQKDNEIFKSLATKPEIQQNKIIEEFKKAYQLGDSVEQLKKITDESIDLVLTDPPYGINYTNTRRLVSINGTEDGILNDHEDNLDLLRAVAVELFRTLKNGRHLYWFGTWKTISKQAEMLEEVGFKVVNQIIYEKENHTVGNTFFGFAPKYEVIIFAVKKVGNVEVRGLKNNGLNRPDDIIQSTRESIKIHDHQKPRELLNKLLQHSSFEKETVLDPFAGSGSTLMASLEAKRHCIGYELNPTVYENSITQWTIQKAKEQQPTLDL